MTAMQVQQAVLTVRRAEQDEVFAKHPDLQWQIAEFGCHCHRLPEPAEVFAAGRAFFHVGEFSVLRRDGLIVIGAVAETLELTRLRQGTLLA